MVYWNSINDQELINIYYRAIDLNLDQDFIQFLIEELYRRHIEIPKDKECIINRGTNNI